MIPGEYFTGEGGGNGFFGAELEVLTLLQSKYLDTEITFADRCRTAGDTARYEGEMKGLNEAAEGWASVIEGSKYLRRALFLTRGNLLLRRGQSEAELFYDPERSYKRAVVLLEQVYEPDEYERLNLLIRLNLGKYFRNMKRQGRRSDYWRALDEFRAVKDAVEGKQREGELLSQWETYLWLEAKVNMGRCEKYLYQLEEAKTCFWEMLRLLSATEKIPWMEAGLKDSEILLKGWSDFRPAAMKVQLNLDEQMNKDYLEQTLVQLGIVYQKSRDNQAAKALFDIVLKYNPNNVDARNNQGVYLRKTGLPENLEEGKRIFKRLENNRFARINFLKCRLALDRGEDWEKLGEVLEDVLMENPQDLEIQLLKGRYHQMNSGWNGVDGDEGEWERAQEIFRGIYESSPYIRKGTIGLKAYYNMIQDSIVRKKFHQARRELERLLEECMEVGPDRRLAKSRSVDLLAEIDLGWCFINIGEYEKAKVLYCMILDEYKTNEHRMKAYNMASLRNNLGECCLRLGEVHEAVKEFEAVIKEEPRNSTASRFLGQCNLYLAKIHDKNGEWEEAKERLETARRRFAEAAEAAPDDIYINSGWLLARILLLEKQQEKDRRLISSIEKSLKYSSGAFSLRACFCFGAFIRERASASGADSEEMDTLYRAFARIPLGENEEGSGAFRHFQADDSFRRLEARLRGRILMQLFRIYEHVIEVKETCRCCSAWEESAGIPVHYTKLSVLKKLLEEKPEKPSEKPPRLRLWNTVYMNDSFEGDAFIGMLEELSQDKLAARRLLGRYFHHLNNSSEEMAPINGNVYVTSFSLLEDSIHMWNAYGEDARGCAITFADDFFDIRDPGEAETGVSVYSDKDYPLYKVQYIDDEVFGRVLEESETGGGEDHGMRELQNRLRAIWIELKQMEELFEAQDREFLQETASGKERLWQAAENACRNFIADCLNEIRFLFKNIEYEHEKELRIIRYSHEPEIDEQNFQVPRLFVEVEREIHMKNVRLGKKINRQEANGIVSWLYKTGKVDRVNESLRHYQ